MNDLLFAIPSLLRHVAWLGLASRKGHKVSNPVKGSGVRGALKYTLSAIGIREMSLALNASK